MPLVQNAFYTIRNDLTHTVLDFGDLTDGNVLARGWGWNGGDNQKWKLIRDTRSADQKWRLQNQRLYEGRRRLLARHGDPANSRLVGVTTDTTLIIEQIPGPSERYRILHDANSAVTLRAGEGVLDLHADGPPISIEAVVNDKQSPTYRAQLWSFLRISELPQPVEDGSYQIVNNQTGLVLDLAEHNIVHGLVSRHDVDQKWIVTKVQNNDCYRFQNSRVPTLFLAPPPGAAPGNNTALSGRVVGEAARFTVRKVPGTQFYKIFFDSLVAPPHHSARGLAVNLANAISDAAPGAVNLSQTDGAQTQTWSFV